MERTVKDNPGAGRPPLSLMQILGLLGLGVSLLIAIDFNQKLADANQMRQAADQAASEVAQLEMELAILQTQVAYATTDAAVIAWAHESGKLIQPGEVLVVPVIPTPLPTAVPQPTPAPPPPPNWMLWRDVFFGAPLAQQ